MTMSGPQCCNHFRTVSMSIQTALTSDSDGVIGCSGFCCHLTCILSCIISCHIINRDDRPHLRSSGCGPCHIEGGSSNCFTGQIKGTALGDSREGAGCEIHNYWSHYRHKEERAREWRESEEVTEQ